MPPPSPLVIATGAVNRLLKEEASYHKELEEQEAQVKAQEEKVKSGQEDEEGNATYILKQQVSRCHWSAYTMLLLLWRLTG
jgi:tubulin-specific chaperone A